MHPEDRLSHNWLIKKLVNDKVKEHLPTLNGTVVDLGCGTRPYEAEILERAVRYVGVDWGKTLHGLRADVVADLSRPLPFADASVECVVSFEVLEHVSEPALLLREAHRIMKPGGTLLLSVPFQWWVHEEPWDFYRYTRHGLAYLLGKAGYTDIQVMPTSGFWSMWTLKLNYQTARLVKASGAARGLVRAAFIPCWWLGQTLAQALDRVWREERETAGYFVVARKP